MRGDFKELFGLVFKIREVCACADDYNGVAV